MISRINRFRGLGSLRYVFKSGRTVRGQLLGIKFSHNPKRSAYRLTVIVSRKVNKSAVARNRIRRRIYEIVRELQTDILAPYDIVITVYDTQIDNLSYQELRSTISDRFSEAGILSKRLK